MSDTRIACKTREEWLALRRQIVGASDAAAILGVAKWGNALSLYADKRGLKEDVPEKPWMRLGRKMEGVVAEMYMEDTGRTVEDLGPLTIMRNPELPWHGCTLDRTVEDKDKGPGLLEIKWGAIADDWKDEPPIAYQVQLQHQLAVVGAIAKAEGKPEPTWGSLAVVLGAREFRFVDVPRNDRFIRVLLKAELEFWQKVEAGDPPEVDGSEHSREALKALYPHDDGTEIELPAEAETWVATLEEAKAASKKAGEYESLAGNKLREAMGAATFGVLPSGRRLSLKTVKKDAYTVKPQEYRTLRILKEKEKA